jgi:hypothetical protein
MSVRLGAQSGSKNPNGIIIDEEQSRQLYDTYHQNPVIRIARDAFISMVLGCPFKLKLNEQKKKKKNGDNDRETTGDGGGGGSGAEVKTNKKMEALIETYWMPWLIAVYDWEKMFGIVPYYIKEIDVNGVKSERVPIVPPFGSGFITTFFKRKEQHFLWYWDEPAAQGQNMWYSQLKNGALRPDSKPDLAFQFIVTSPPTLRGKYTSKLASFLSEQGFSNFVRETEMYAQYWRTHPAVVVEHHPPDQLNQQDADSLISMPALGEESVEFEQADIIREARDEQKQARKLMAGQRQIQKAIQVAERMNSMRHTYTSAEPAEQIMSRQSSDMPFSKHRVNLPQHHKFAQMATPAPRGDYDRLMIRADSIAASIMDVPIEMFIPTHGGKSANIEGNLRFINIRIRSVTSAFQRYVKEAYMGIYADAHRRQLKALIVRRRTLTGKPLTREVLTMLAARVDVRVEFLCTPLSTYEQLKLMHDDGVIDHDTLGEYALQLAGIPEWRRVTDGDEARRKVQDMEMRPQLEMQQRQFDQQKQLEAMKPPPGSGGGGGSSVTGKKRAPSSSGNTTSPDREMKKTRKQLDINGPKE